MVLIIVPRSGWLQSCLLQAICCRAIINFQVAATSLRSAFELDNFVNIGDRTTLHEALANKYNSLINKQEPT
jgi:hypothetical protein